MIGAFTGHRPDKLGGYKLPNPTYVKVCKEIDWLLRELNPEKVISGMALGVDQWAANIARKLEIPFIAAIPFENQESKWPLRSQRAYHLLLKYASEKVIVSPGGYEVAKMQVRNRWMVDNSDFLIAVWDGSKGGTANCVEYAETIGRKIYRIDPTKL
jgi:uncharacterized phage-like protein YoqJ